LALGARLGLGRRTVTGLLVAIGQLFVDWTAAFRLFQRERFDAEALFAPGRRAVCAQLGPPDHAPFVALLDDTHFRKTGKKVHGTQWRRDPLGPKFQTNLVWSQRFLQISAAWPDAPGPPGGARAVPIDVRHCPSPPKPRKGADEEEWARYRKTKDESKITRRAAERLHALRQSLDQDGQADRILVLSHDGGYTNAAVLRQRPERTVLIGRLRKDAKLYAPPPPPAPNARGRKPLDGPERPTPDQMRKDDTLPWQTVRAFAAGKLHDFQVNVVRPVRGRGAGADDLAILIVKPLAYRLSKQSALLYREPAYIVCTDPDLAPADILQYFLWRLGIEGNFRDEKTLVGAGQAHVRRPASVRLVLRLPPHRRPPGPPDLPRLGPASVAKAQTRSASLHRQSPRPPATGTVGPGHRRGEFIRLQAKVDATRKVP